jgi:hypothetical protein
MRAPQRHTLATAALLTIAAAGAGSAHAADPIDYPPNCNTSTMTRNAYKAGLKVGEKVVQVAWQSINDCDQVEHFLDVVGEDVDHLTLPVHPSAATVCRYTGTVDGVYNKLDALYGTCADQCFLDGQFAGELSGEVYCELSIALGGLAAADDFLRGPVAVCGFNFEVGCDSSFISVTETYANTDGLCEPFTVGEFSEVWEQARNNQCAYEPDPDPNNFVSELNDESKP